MTKTEVEAKSQVICQKILKDINWQKVKTVSAFGPIAQLNEVAINPLLTDISKLYLDIKIDVMGQSKTEGMPEKKFDLILVPCLAFDKQNYRLGWGGGFYDKFLASHPQSLKIGLCFQNSFAKSGLPREPHDIPLDKIITEV